MLKLITCIAGEEQAKKATEGLAEKYGIQAMVSYFARGFGRSSPLATQKLGQQTEKVIIHVVVHKKIVDDVFAYIFHAADLDRPHGGLIYVTAVNNAIVSPIAEIQEDKENLEE